jgi:acetyl-CoA carboxylase alpha subunit/acetyl-CoA carboxylase beta subunit
VSDERLRAEAWARLLLDDGFAEILDRVRSGDPLRWPGYPEARAAAPGDEAVRVWRGAVGGRPVVCVTYDFAHLGGSQGAGAGARVTAAFRAATELRVPVVTVTSTGGSRMQEGTVALAQMPVTLVAAGAHAAAGLLQITVAADPTTGGVYASFAGQADLVVSEPGAYVGFAGRRVAEALGAPLPPDVNRAEWGHAHGLVDAVVPRAELRAWIARALAAVAPPTPGCERFGTPAVTNRARPGSAWAAVEAARAQDRPRASDCLARMDDVVRLRGDRCGGDDGTVLACIARLDGLPVGVVGLERAHVRPAGYRVAWRLLALADRLGLPVLTLIDTPGADASPPSEAAGLAHAIGATIARLLALRVPTLAAVIGEGGSGGAMALAPADVLLVQRSAVFSVIAPEGAAAILHRDAARAPEVAEQLALTANDLVALGVADAVVGDGIDTLLAEASVRLRRLATGSPRRRHRARLARWGTMGQQFTVEA